MEIIESSSKNEIQALIEELNQYDNNKGYKLSYEQVKKKSENTVSKLAEIGEKCIEHLHPLLEHEETWSCALALEALKRIKSEKSVFPLISFIKMNEEGDYWDWCDDALSALIEIGEQAINPLLNEIKNNFQNKEYYGYLVGALTGIKHDDVYSFMFGVLEDYLKNSEKYDEWLEIDDFTYNFSVQGKKEALPLLKKLLAMEHLSEKEKREIESTIEVIEDPEKFNKEIEDIGKGFEKYANIKKEDINEIELLKQAVDFEEKKGYEDALECIAKILAVYPKSYHALLLDARINRKLGKPTLMVLGNAMEEAKKQKAGKEVLELMKEEQKKISELYHEVESTADEDFELNFKCLTCNKRQNLKTGLIWDIGDEEDYSFENEIMCKHCFSHNLEITEQGKMQLTGKKMRIFMGQEGGILDIGEIYVGADKQKVKFKESYLYLLRKIKENPYNGENYLRAANSARKQNKYEDALKHYKKAIELNPKLIAVYVNLFEIYVYRHTYYKIKESKDEAIYYLKKLREIYDTKDYDNTTLKNFGSLIEFIREKEAEFGLSSFYKKVSDDEIKNVVKDASTLDITNISKNITLKSKISQQEINKLLDENKGIITFQSYHIFDKKTNESKSLQLSSVLPVDLSKLCICGSGKYTKECCFNHIRKKIPFVANLDYETYSLFEPVKEAIKSNEEFDELVKGFKDDARFYCDTETDSNTFFLYYGNTFFSEKDLGTVVFGTFEIKKTFMNKCKIIMEALSKNRFESLKFAVEEHLE